jgi:hypothetical protein
MEQDPGFHRALTHLQRHGDLSFRLARAILGSEEAAAEVVIGVFDRLARMDRLPSWFETLNAVRQTCMSAPYADTRPDSAPQPEPATNGEHEPDALHVTIPRQDAAAAFFELEQSDRDVLWSALLDRGQREPLADDVDALAEALLRLEVAVGNLSIPGEGDPEWPE